MGSTGEVVTQSGIADIGIRCPIGDCRVVDAPFALTSEIVAGQAYAISNMLAVALKSRSTASTVQSVPCAYEIPVLKIGSDFGIGCKPAAAWPVGMRLGFKAASNIMVPLAAGYHCVGYVLEAKAANASDCLIHFKGDAAADIAISST